MAYESSLDSSLELFEEANKLITKCSQKLSQAEQKIEVLIKNRNSEIELNETTPKTENFIHNKEQ